MNITIELPNLGYNGVPIQVQKEDNLKTRVVRGNGSSLLHVPGLLSLERVRYKGGEHEAKVVRELPMDHTLRNFMNVVVDGVRILGEGEETYLERHPWCNDGTWQEEPFWITGEWDESLNPPAAGPITAPPETMRRPLLTTGPEGVVESGSRPGRKSAAQIAAEAETTAAQ